MAPESWESKYGPLNQARNWLERISKGVATLGAAAVIIMMLSISADVLVRKFWGKPIPGVAEINELFMVIIIFLGLGITQILDKNIRMDAVISKLSPRTRHYLHIFTTALAIGIVSLLVLQSGIEALESVTSREFRFGSIPFPLWPSKLSVPIGSAILLLVLVVDLLRRVFPSSGSSNEGGK